MKYIIIIQTKHSRINDINRNKSDTSLNYYFKNVIF